MDEIKIIIVNLVKLFYLKVKQIMSNKFHKIKKQKRQSMFYLSGVHCTITSSQIQLPKINSFNTYRRPVLNY